MTGGRGPERRPSSRVLLSLFFLIHFGAIGVYVLPVGEAAVAFLPDRVAEPVGTALLESRRRLLYASTAYLSLFSLQQHWSLFAPEPLRWAGSVRVHAWWPDGGGGWIRRVHEPPSFRTRPPPRWGEHREWRVHSNLGYEGWPETYGPVFADVQCLRLRDARGRRPYGVTLEVVWDPVVPPWGEETGGDTTYVQPLGGFDCPPRPRR